MSKKEEESLRVRQVQEWLLQGQLVTDICRNIMKAWGIDEPKAIKYIADAFDDFTKRADISFKDTISYHIQLRLTLYKKAVEANEFKTALQILADLGKIEGIY